MLQSGGPAGAWEMRFIKESNGISLNFLLAEFTFNNLLIAIFHFSPMNSNETKYHFFLPLNNWKVSVLLPANLYISAMQYQGDVLNKKQILSNVYKSTPLRLNSCFQFCQSSVF